MDKYNLDKDQTYQSLVKKLVAMGDNDFLQFGSEGLSYIKPVNGQNDEKVFALHAGNGAHLATSQNIDILKAYAAQHNMVSVLIH
jgi:hypothetical protein